MKSQVLSDPRRRSIYDQYGEDGLYGDVPPEEDDYFDDDYSSSNDNNDGFPDSQQYSKHPPPPPTSAPRPPSPPKNAAPHPPPGFAPQPPPFFSSEDRYNRDNYNQYSNSGSGEYYDDRPYSTSFEDDYDDCGYNETNKSNVHSRSCDFSSLRETTPPSYNFPSSESTQHRNETNKEYHHHHTHASNQPDPYDIFKRFFGTQDYKAASKKYFSFLILHQ